MSMNDNWFYLWYSAVLLFPSVHELGHCVIGWLSGGTLIEVYWNKVVFSGNADWLGLQGLWEHSPLISIVCGFLFLYLFLKDIRVVKNKMKEVNVC